MKTKVVNLRIEKFDIYIGRAGKGQDGYWGNPHNHGFCKVCHKPHTRTECIEAYKQDFYKRIEKDPVFRNRLKTLKGKTLGCFCKPQACHGDVIAEYVNSLN